VEVFALNNCLTAMLFYQLVREIALVRDFPTIRVVVARNYMFCLAVAGGVGERPG